MPDKSEWVAGECRRCGLKTTIMVRDHYGFPVPRVDQVCDACADADIDSAQQEDDEDER